MTAKEYIVQQYGETWLRTEWSAGDVMDIMEEYGKYCAEKPLPTDEQIEANGIEGGLRDGELQMFWEGAKWMRDLIQERRNQNEQTN